MKKDIKNKNESENIVLDEESQKDEKKKPTVKKILGAVLLILLAVVFAVLGFCVVGGAFDGNTKCNVAFADSSTPVVTNLQLQASSNYTLENISQYTSLYGVFFNKSFSLSYQDCVDNSSYFSSMEDERLIQITITSTSNPVGNDITFKFFPMIMTQAYFQELGGQGTLSAPVYYVECSLSDVRGDSSYYIFNYTVANNDDDFNMVSSIPLIPVYTKEIKYSMLDFVSLTRGTSYSYSSFVPSVIGFDSSIFSFWSKFLYLSLPSIGSSGISQADYDRVVSERDTAITERDNAISDYNDYKSLLESQFSYVPEVYINPTNSTKHERVFIDKNSVFGVFVVNASKSISDIIDSNGNLLLSINGLNVSPDSSAVWQRLFALQGYQGFVSICNIAHLTPKDSTITPKGMICSYDIKNKRLTVWRNVISFADVDLETIYSAFGDSYEDYGASVTQADRKATTDGIISVLESPVNFLKTVFNFEIFGINISAVVFFVVSIVIVAFVIKKVV